MRKSTTDDFDFEITKNTEDEFQVLVKNVVTAEGIQDIYFTIEYRNVKPYFHYLGPEVALYWVIIWKIAEKEWKRLRQPRYLDSRR